MKDITVSRSLNNQGDNITKPNKSAFMKVLLAILYLVLIAMVVGAGLMYLQSRSKLTESNSKVISLEKQVDSTKNELESTKKELASLKDTNGEDNIKKDQFQSVFLKSGQVYFGKITKITTSQIKLENIYYLRDGGGALVKLGAELHGPEDVMYIERQNVEFWENLKPDGEVAKAIKDYETHN